MSETALEGSAVGGTLPSYDRSRTYAWNYDHPPEPVRCVVPEMAGTWDFCGLRVASPLGVPAGPLLNGRWLLYYASLGFDVLTYKTVRSRSRTCYPLPNLQPVKCGDLQGGERDLSVAREADVRSAAAGEISWAVSYGMPSQAPSVWRDDVAWTRRNLDDRKVLCVSVVGSHQPGWTIDDLGRDYAECAAWALACGADCVEANFSCPNVNTCDGQLYQQPRDAERVARLLRDRVGERPLIIKVGHLTDAALAEELLERLAPWVDALAVTNSVAATVRDESNRLLFDGQPRGICGAATRAASLRQTRMLRELIRKQRLSLKLIGVGGISSAEHVSAYLSAGSHAVQIATAAMLQPDVALKIRAAWPADVGDRRGTGARTR